jgi:hypothetical protein
MATYLPGDLLGAHPHTPSLPHRAGVPDRPAPAAALPPPRAVWSRGESGKVFHGLTCVCVDARRGGGGHWPAVLVCLPGGVGPGPCACALKLDRSDRARAVCETLSIFSGDSGAWLRRRRQRHAGLHARSTHPHALRRRNVDVGASGGCRCVAATCTPTGGGPSPRSSRARTNG